MDNPTQAKQLEDIEKELTKTLTRLQTFRRQYDPGRLKLYRQYIGNKTPQMYPDNLTPRSSVSAMYPYSNVEAIVSRVHDAFFTYEDWFEARPRGAGDDAAARAMNSVLNYKLKRANLTGQFELFVRNICIYGHAAIKVDWDRGTDRITKPQAILVPDPNTGQPVINPMTGQPIVMGVQPVTTDVPKARPKFTPIDVFDLLIDPDGCTVAHLAEKPLGQIMKDAASDPNLYFPDALKKLVDAVTAAEPGEPSSVLIRLAEVWNDDGTCAVMTFAKDFKENLSWKDQRSAARTGANISTYKRKIYAGAPILLWYGDSPFMHKKIPILHTSYVKLPNEVFGIGAVETISSLSDGYDRFLNMITDNWNLNINKRYAYDTSAEIDHESLNNFNVPGGKVGVAGNPNEVIFPIPAFTPAPGDYEIMPMYKGMIEMASGISDFYAKGIGGAGGNDTATGISSVITESNFRFKEFIRNLELDVLQPLLDMCASMCQQFLTDEQEVEITDEQAGIPKLIFVQPEELLGAVDFQLVAANYTNNKLIKQRNLMALQQVLMQNPYVNVGALTRQTLKTFEIPNIDELIKSDQQVQMEQQQQMQQQVEMMMLEAALQAESKARMVQSTPITTKTPEGRPRTTQPEGPIQGAGLTTEIHELASDLTGRSLGLGGMGQVPGKQ